VSDRFNQDRELIERRISEVCQTYLRGLPPSVADSIRYGLTGPGKRLRPLLVVFAYRAAGGTGDPSLLASAVEVVHCYSLIHDDLPCMDDDAVRRGRPTVHKVYGSKAAILGGVAMVPLATIVARDAMNGLALSLQIQRRVLETLLDAVGARGMIGGQQSDLAGEGLSLSLEERERIHSGKTGALIVGAARLGALAAGATDDQLHAFERYGRDIGLAFQIMDDVLDVTSTTAALGKTSGRDAVLGKSTYPALLGVDGARDRAHALVEDGLESLREQGLLTQELSQVANFMVTRTS
jgi:farnesyl diphosphate synthase/geranylgeranyl diphosphate synthase type II